MTAILYLIIMIFVFWILYKKLVCPLITYFQNQVDPFETKKKYPVAIQAKISELEEMKITLSQMETKVGLETEIQQLKKDIAIEQKVLHELKTKG